MKAAPFDYIRARSIEEACAVLEHEGDSAKLIAGGQSLVPMMAMRLSRPSMLVDINEIAELKSVAIEPEVVRTGACVRQCIIERDEVLAIRVPLLRQALAWVGHIQTRNRGTLGGSLAHADPAAELPLVAQVLGARLLVRSADATRNVPAESFFVGPMMSSLAADECVEAIEWPVWPERRSGSAFTELSIRHGDFAIVAAAAQVALEDSGRCTRAVFGLAGVGQTPLAFPRLTERLAGTQLDDAALRETAHAAARMLEPSSDLHATSAYRVHLARVLGERVLREAYEKAEAVR